MHLCEGDRIHLLEKYLAEDKLCVCEEIGDFVKANSNSHLALFVYLRAGCHKKVVECFAEKEEFENIILYSKKVDYTPDYLFLIRNVLSEKSEEGMKFAQMLVNADPVALG